MSVKDTYTAEEWSAIMIAPVLAGSYIAMADPGVTSLVGETSAMMKAMTSGEVPADVKDLVGGIVADMKEMADKKEKLKMPAMTDEMKSDPAAAKAALLDKIAGATQTVSDKGGVAEAAAFKQWLLSIANATAEAAREGGFMGIGGTRVSDDEKMAMAEIRSAIDA